MKVLNTITHGSCMTNKYTHCLYDNTEKNELKNGNCDLYTQDSSNPALDSIEFLPQNGLLAVVGQFQEIEAGGGRGQPVLGSTLPDREETSQNTGNGITLVLSGGKYSFLVGGSKHISYILVSLYKMNS